MIAAIGADATNSFSRQQDWETGPSRKGKVVSAVSVRLFQPARRHHLGWCVPASDAVSASARKVVAIANCHFHCHYYCYD